jgi:hypothetical protein
VSRPLRFGYAYWGFLGDVKYHNNREVSTPDGNASYSWSILWEVQRRGWDVFLLQRDRDWESWNRLGDEIFGSFATTERTSAYMYAHATQDSQGHTLASLDDLGGLDVVLIEWRWPIPGRNTPSDEKSPEFQPDLLRQREILRWCQKKKIPVIIWDLDHKLTAEDEVLWEPRAIFETSMLPLKLTMDRVPVMPPVLPEVLLEHATRPCSPTRKLVYIGSRYERDEAIDTWIKPVSEEFPFEVEFWGNWTNEPHLSEARERWPNVLLNGRIGMRDFRRVYSTAAAVPLLAKESYQKTGFMTPRPWEAIIFGSIPVGFYDHLGVREITPYVAEDPDDFVEMVWAISELPLHRRDEDRRDIANNLGEMMDVKWFVDAIEKCI